MKRRVPVVYNDVDSPLHRRDPRAKLALFALLVSLIYVAPTWHWILGLAVLGLGMAAVARVPVKWVAVLLALQVPQALSFLAFPALERMAAGQPAFGGSFDYALKITLSWPAALFLSASIFTTMELTELTDALRALGVPEVAVFTVEYVFLLFYVTISDLYRVLDAMKVKGLEIETRNPITLARNLPGVGIPMFLTVLRRSNTMMAVMKMRGYSFTGDRELRTELEFGVGDAVLVLLGVAVLATSAAVRVGWATVPVLPAAG
ncbi:energy-coupling factor transporter transmembrane component T family protein [Halorussus sp. AFM4]|uniref:energy-coupling factor transporter transmembrane component T family protein n=1 Tax=Halorussus sp. AFM4 TaxID=3421651 RepID=UPI003EB99BC3